MSFTVGYVRTTVAFLPLVLLSLSLTPLFISCSSPSELEMAQARLEEIRDEKQAQLEDYFSHVEASVTAVRTDTPLIDAFEGLRQLYTGAQPARSAAKLDEQIVERYLTDYQIFYDIHFIALDGEIFYTLLKQDNMFENLFDPNLQGWRLAERLKEAPEESAVDFQVVPFSDEPSAFFAEPVVVDGEQTGWIVLQYASARLNEIFGYDPALGETGEVFLVNQNHFLLTRAQNRAEPSVLQQHLSAQNIEKKFAMGEGTLEVTDYRGYRCLTSFAVTEILDFTWLLIAKIDVAEVMTREYLQHDSRYYAEIRETLRRAPVAEVVAADPRITEPPADREVIRVNLDDYRRATGDVVLETPGVATCTTMIVALPGEFAYMAHISPYDRIYDGTRTDLVSSVLRRLRAFDIPDKRMREIEVTLITPTIRYSDSLITEFARAGIFLSQITVMKNPTARCADVRYDLAHNSTVVTWCDDQLAPMATQRRARTPSVGEIMDTLL